MIPMPQPRTLAAVCLILIIALPLAVAAQEIGEVGESAPTIPPPRDPGPELYFRTSPHAGLGYGATSGDWYGDLDGALALEAGIRFATGYHSYVHVLYIHQGLESVQMDLDPDGLLGPQSVSLDFSTNEFYFLYGGQISQNRTSGQLLAFEVGAGIMNHRSSIDYGLLDFSASESKLGLIVRLDALIPVGEHLAVDLAIDSRWKPGIVIYEDESAGNILGMKAGLAYH